MNKAIEERAKARHEAILRGEGETPMSESELIAEIIRDEFEKCK